MSARARGPLLLAALACASALLASPAAALLRAETPALPNQQPFSEGGIHPAVDSSAPAISEPLKTAAAAAPQPAAPAEPKEKIEADVSTRSVAVTSGFAGSEIIVFGSVDNSRQPSAEAGYYDVVVVVEGTPMPVTARRKSRVAGVWVNTSALRFDSIPSYYAIASTRPLDDFADEKVLQEHAIGFQHAKMRPRGGRVPTYSEDDLKEYKAAIVRLKQKDGLYITRDYGVAFIGRSLFRSSVTLPANVPVGPLTAKVFLFHQGEMLSQFTAHVTLQREGIERWLYEFAFGYPFLYGVFTVMIAVAAGLIASTVFRRGTAG